VQRKKLIFFEDALTGMISDGKETASA
jgi:hypothetical protein